MHLERSKSVPPFGENVTHMRYGTSPDAGEVCNISPNRISLVHYLLTLHPYHEIGCILKGRNIYGRQACKPPFVGKEDVENAVIIGLPAFPDATGNDA